MLLSNNSRQQYDGDVRHRIQIEEYQASARYLPRGWNSHESMEHHIEGKFHNVLNCSDHGPDGELRGSWQIERNARRPVVQRHVRLSQQETARLARTSCLYRSPEWNKISPNDTRRHSLDLDSMMKI